MSFPISMKNHCDHIYSLIIADLGLDQASSSNQPILTPLVFCCVYHWSLDLTSESDWVGLGMTLTDIV